MRELIKKLHRTANIGLYGSILIVLTTIVFHYCPYQISFQQPQVARWMLISGAVLAVLAIVMALQVIRRSTPRLRKLDNLDAKLQGYTDYISNLYRTILGIVVVECALIVLMSDNSLLMVTILLILLLFLAYPNMYKMKNDLGLTDDQMRTLFGSQYIADTPITDETQIPKTVDSQQIESSNTQPSESDNDSIK